MKKEHIKSAILIALVITNLGLNSRIWSNKKLWPSGYNFFSNVRNSLPVRAITNFFNQNNINYVSKNRINTPKQIIINTGYQSTRFALSPTHDMFDSANELSHNILTSALSQSSRSVSSITQEEWYSVLTSKSLYLNYNVEYDTTLFAQFFGIADNALASFTEYITDIVIAPDAYSSAMSVYIKNAHTNTYHKITTSMATDEISQLIEYFQQGFDETDTDSSNIINYSFDLFFDQGEQKVILSPMIPMFSNPQVYEIIKSENPVVKSDGTADTSIIDKLLNAFDINPSTMNRYTEADGTIVFVENDAILKLSPGGIIDFTATADTGIKLSNNTAESAYSAICMAADFMDNVNDGIVSNRNLYLSTDLTNEYISGSTINLNFDYLVSGLPVSMNYKSNTHAVSMIISNGYLQKYTQVLRSYSGTGETDRTTTFIEALDSTLHEYADTPEQVKVDKMYASYTDDGSIGIKNAIWNIIIDKQ